MNGTELFRDVAAELPHLGRLAGRLTAALALGLLLAWRPLSRLAGGRASRPPIAYSFVLMTLAACLVMTIIGDSIARAFGVVGLGSFIRFRSSIKDPSDVALYFVAIGMGLACGLGMAAHAAVGLAFLSVVLVARDRSPAPDAKPEKSPAPPEAVPSLLGRAAAMLLAVLLLPACGDTGEGSGTPGGGGPGPTPKRDPFDPAVMADFEIEMAPSDWNAMTADLTSNVWRRATVRWRGETYADVAIHPAGQSSRQSGIGNPDKPSMWLSFKEFVPGREFHGYERVKLDSMLDDPAMMRERLAYEVYRAAGVPAPKVAHARVLVNGDYTGLYLLEERVNKEFCTKRFGDVVNQLYKWTEAEPDVTYDPAAVPAFYAPNMWTAEIESVPDRAEQVQEFCRRVNEDPGTASGVFEQDAFIQYMAVEVATGETDGYTGHGGGPDFYTGNIFMYRKPGAERFVWIVWDRDQAFWRHEGPLFGFDQRIMTNNLILSSPARLAQYKNALRAVLDGPAHPSVMEPRFDAILAQIQAAALADVNHHPATPLHFEWEELRAFFALRRNELLAHPDLGP